MATAYENPAHGFATQVSLRSYLYYSVLASLFSEAFVFHVGFNFQLSYLLIFGNLVLMLLLAQFSIPKAIFPLAGYLLASGLVGIHNGTDSTVLVAKQFFGILISIFFFYNFFQLRDYRIEKAFHDYAIAAYWCAVVGLFLFPIQVLVGGTQQRLHSILPEPAHFATVCAPALYYFANEWLTRRRYGRQFALLLLAFILSVSSVAYLGIMFALYLLLSRYRYCTIMAPLLIGSLLGMLLIGSSQFRMRAVDTFAAIQNSDVAGANLSTFALVTNMIVTENVMEESPIFGNGIGSHVMSHQRYLERIPGIREFAAINMENLNAEDAASLFLRVLSELGIVGLIGVLAFIWHFHVPGHGPRAQISYAILVYFFLKLLRHGHYFSPEQYFFVLIYVFNYGKFKVEQRIAQSTAGRFA